MEKEDFKILRINAEKKAIRLIKSGKYTDSECKKIVREYFSIPESK